MKPRQCFIALFLVPMVAALVVGAGYQALMINNSNQCAQTVDFRGAVSLEGVSVDSSKITYYDAHLVDTSNPHTVTAAQIGGGNIVTEINADTANTINANKLSITSDDLGADNIISTINTGSLKIDSPRLDVVGLGLGDMLAANNLSDLDSVVASKANLSLENVENTKLSTWAGTSNLTTLGTISTGTWAADLISVSRGGTGASSAANARTSLGIGTMGTQSASSVSITGGSVSGITDLAITDGGTGSSTAQGARTNLLPSQSGHSSKYLQTNGSEVSWAEVAGGGHTLMDSTDSAYSQRANIKFGAEFSVTDNSGNDSTDISLVDTDTTFDSAFVDGNLTAGVLTLAHDLGKKVVSVIIANNSDKQVIPDDVNYSSTSTCTVDLSSFGTLSGTWNAFVSTGGKSVSGGGGGGEWELVERKDFSSSAANYTFTGLDGDADVRYRLVFYIINAYAGDIVIYASPNADNNASHYRAMLHYALNGGSYGVAIQTSHTGMVFAASSSHGAAGGVIVADGMLFAKSGSRRLSKSDSFDGYTNTVQNELKYGVIWNNTADNITSIKISSSRNDTFAEVTGIDGGSYVELWKLAE